METDRLQSMQISKLFFSCNYIHCYLFRVLSLFFHRYKTVSDPTIDDVRRLCQSLRRNAKDDRILFHYNGHGVPRPTENGEIWVLNKNFTQVLEIFQI